MRRNKIAKIAHKGKPQHRVRLFFAASVVPLDVFSRPLRRLGSASSNGPDCWEPRELTGGVVIKPGGGNEASISDIDSDCRDGFFDSRLPSSGSNAAPSLLAVRPRS